VARTYRVLVAGPVDERVLARLRRGVLLEDGPARADEARRVGRNTGGQAWLALTLREGRYREVKRLCRAVDLRVVRLVRVAYGPLRLGRLLPGGWRNVSRGELAALRADRPDDA
jgi:23S rRNA pseudouridine2605 synthase